MPTVLVTGASRGLGLEFVRQYAAAGWTVLACARVPDEAAELARLATAHPDVAVHALDVTRYAAVGALARALAGTPIDVLLNNAGRYGPKPNADDDPRQELGHFDPAVFEELLRVNAVAPLRMAEAFLPHVAASGQRKIVAISSSMGSIAEGGGGAYAYRMSKAALNGAMATLARDVAARGIRVGIYCPGWVRTAMGGPRAPLAPPESVAALRARIAELDEARSGTFVRYDGTPVPW